MKLSKAQIMVKATVTREGDVFLFMEPHYWGKSPASAKAAALQSRKAGGLGESGRRWAIYSAPPECYVDEMGYINYPEGHGILMIAEYDVEKNKRWVYESEKVKGNESGGRHG